MRMFFAAAALVVAAGTAYAQEEIPNINPSAPDAAAVVSARAKESSVFHVTSPALRFLAVPGVSSVAPLSGALATESAASPAPSPPPEPKFVFGGRDDYRWQVAIGADWLRFRSSIFNASGVGIASSLTYFTNDWFGVEGDVTTAFAPQIFDREHVKLLVYGGGPKIAWREHQWEPWAHIIVGGAHEMPQTANNSKNAFAVVLGGGADYRFNPRLSGRLEGDWVRTTFFSQSQTNFELMGGIVFHL